MLISMATPISDPALLRLLQLASVSLPVGGFSFSQGLEYAVENGWLSDYDDVSEWLYQQLQGSLKTLDLAVFFRLYKAKQCGDEDDFFRWNNLLIASRETSELRLTDEAMGRALAKLLPTIGVPMTILQTASNTSHKTNSNNVDLSFVSAFTLAANHWGIPASTGAIAFTWSWLENQVAAATKLVPLGQTQAQCLLGDLQTHIPAAVEAAQHIQDDDIGTALPALAIASALHETQYSRLFRS